VSAYITMLPLIERSGEGRMDAGGRGEGGGATRVWTEGGQCVCVETGKGLSSGERRRGAANHEKGRKRSRGEDSAIRE
jgi:hypothetical protein